MPLMLNRTRSLRPWLLLPVALLVLARAASASHGATEIIDATGDGAGNPLDRASSVAVHPSGNVYVTGLDSDGALYATSALAALIGADAPSLSLARLMGDGHVEPSVAVSGIVVVAIAATLGKIAIVAVGNRGEFAIRVGTSLLGTVAVGAAVFAALRY